MILFDQIALMDADHNAETQWAIRDAANNRNTCNMCFWAPNTIRGHRVLLEISPGTWTPTNVHSLPMLGITTRFSSDLWNEWPYDKAFLKM